MRSAVVYGIKCIVFIFATIGAVIIGLLTGVLALIELLCIAAVVILFTQNKWRYPLESGRIGQEVFIYWIWLVAKMTSGACVQVFESSLQKQPSTTSVIVIAPHPPMDAAMGLLSALMRFFDGPVRWAIKWELMLWFAPFILPFVIAGAGYPLVRESKTLSRWVLRWFGAIQTGVAVIFPDGTRPGEKKGRAAQRWLRGHGQPERMSQWDLPLALPRPGGVATLLKANPTARVVLAVTSGGVPGQSVIADFWSLVFGPQQTYKVWLIELDRKALDTATAQGDVALGQLLVKLWIDTVFPLLKAGGMQPMENEE